MYRTYKGEKKVKWNKRFAMMGLSTILIGSNVNAATIKCLNQNNTNLVPLRVISEELGATVGFDKNNQTVTVEYRGNVIEAKIGNKTATVNGNKVQLSVPPQVSEGTTYVPIRFIGEALGGAVSYQNGVLKLTIGDLSKEWQVQTINASPTKAQASTFASGSQTVRGKKVTYVTINMNDPAVKVKVATANNKVTQAAALKTLAAGAKVGVNGTYFAAYNGDTPLPDGTLVVNGKTVHITDIGSTIGFTSDNKVLIDVVQTRVQGYVNGQESWLSYRVNRPGSDTSTTLIYTPEYEQKIPLSAGWSAVVCINGKVEKIVTESRTVPNNGFILVTTKPGKFNIGDTVSYKTVYRPTKTSATDWENVIYALSAGPSLMINGEKTGDPANEKFTEAKILTHSAQRTFIGVNKDNKVMIGTVGASVNELKNIVKDLGLTSAMCLDGGASSGLYYNGSYLTSPGRQISNSINFYA